MRNKCLLFKPISLQYFVIAAQGKEEKTPKTQQTELEKYVKKGILDTGICSWLEAKGSETSITTGSALPKKPQTQSEEAFVVME